MGVTNPPQVALCEAWYKAFDSRDIRALMALFSDDPVVTIGAGGTQRCVPYHGTFLGRAAVEWYYRCRFEWKTQSEIQQAASGQQLNPNRRMFARGGPRQDCGFQRNPYLANPWVIYTGNIEDHPELGSYNGPYLHVFRIVDGTEMRIASLDMFFAPGMVQHAASAA